MSKYISRPIATLGLSFAMVAPIATAGWAIVPKDAVKLAPHLAVYEMVFDGSRPGSGVVGVVGRMVFKFTGSDCDGYTLNMRLVTQITDRQGRNTLSDIRSSSWEKGDGSRFRFNSSQYLNRRLSEATSGDASRKENSAVVQVRLKKPSRARLELPANTVFPTQHSKIVIDAATKGKSIVEVDIFDGSEKGKKAFLTTAFIGKAVPAGSDTTFVKVKNSERLENMESWPVAISYYDKENKKKPAGVPSYELAFRLYKNGVSRKLLIDYGDFAIRGALSSIEFYDAGQCK